MDQLFVGYSLATHELFINDNHHLFMNYLWAIHQLTNSYSLTIHELFLNY